MRFLERWYYENKGKLWAGIGIVLFVIACIQIANNFYKNKNEEEVSKNANTNTNITSVREEINNEITGQLSGSTSLTTGESVSNEELRKHTEIIDEFVEHCSNGRIQEAYSMLTDACKEEVFPTIESFKNKYYNNVFSTPKTYSLQNWSGDTYKIMIIDDALSTGKVSSTNTHLQEYMTIVSDSENGKLNINSYIGRTEENKVITTDELEVTFIKKETYMDYEEYTIKVRNLTNKEITLDKGTSTKTIYLVDGNNVKQYANTGEIDYANLTLKPGASKQYTFKFSNAYSKTRIMERLVFEKVIISDETTDEPIKLMINL